LTLHSHQLLTKEIHFMIEKLRPKQNIPANRFLWWESALYLAQPDGYNNNMKQFSSVEKQDGYQVATSIYGTIQFNNYSNIH